MTHDPRRSLVVVAALLLVGACSSTPDATPPGAGTVRVQGNARLDGKPLTAQFLGAVVRADGLVTPCQAVIPTVTQGRFEITVFDDRQSAGCGHPGTEIVLWTYQGEQRLFAETPIEWPTRTTPDAEVTFSPTNPTGAAPMTLTEHFGEVHDDTGRAVPTGSRVEAYIGDNLCGVASTRSGDFNGYLIDIVGPDARPGCSLGATVTFQIDGRRALETTPNDGQGQRDPFNLTVRAATGTPDPTTSTTSATTGSVGS